MKILYIGGVKSGKSRLAEQRSLQIAQEISPFYKPFYLATADPSDRSLASRIERHRLDRGDQFITLEEAFELPTAIATAQSEQPIPHPRVILIDCLTLWLSNVLLRAYGYTVDSPESPAESDRGETPQQKVDLGHCEAILNRQVQALLAMPDYLIFVINDVGAGIHPDSELGRYFADLSGMMAQRVAAGCQEVYHCIAGIGHRIQ